jgi:hypothetical protein
MPSVRSLLLLTLVVAFLAGSTGIAANQQATPVAIETEQATAMPQLSEESEMTASPSPAASPEISDEDCDAYSVWEHVDLYSRLAPVLVAMNEAGLSAGAPAPADIDLEPDIARQVAMLNDTFLELYAEVEVPRVAQDVNENFLATTEAISTGLYAYADAVEAGADRDEELNVLLSNLGSVQAEQNADADLAVILKGCDPKPGTDRADTAIAQARDLATVATAASELLSSADVPPVAQAANDALIAYLDGYGNGAAEFADRFEAGEDYRGAANSFFAVVTPLGIAANEPIQTTLERCGISVGVDEPDDGKPPLSEKECADFLAWFEVTAEKLAEFDVLTIRAGVPSIDYGLILPGGYGSPDLSTVSNERDATPIAEASPAGSPITSPVPSPGSSPVASPSATPQHTARECADWKDYNTRQFAILDDFVVAGIEARQLIATGGAPTTDKLTPEAAREIADIIDATIEEYSGLDVPTVAQDQQDAGLAAITAIAAGLRQYADTVEEGADRDQAISDAIYANPDVAEPANRQGDIIDQFQAACYPGAAEDAATYRGYAQLAEQAIQAQSAAKTPRVAREANDALVAALEAYDAAFREYADRIEAGEDREALTAELGAGLLPASIAGTDAIRDLVERCGIPIGITEPDDGQPPLSNGQCKQVFRWYEETAQRLTDLNALDFPFLEAGLTLPGGQGSVDLDELDEPSG